MSSENKEKSFASEKLVPILVIVTIGMAFALGVMWQKVNNLQNTGTTQGSPTQVVDGTDVPQGDFIELGKLTEEQAAKIAPVSDDDNVRGTTQSGVYLIEYSDLECPFCSTFHETAKTALSEFSGQVAWVYRHFPLDQIHPKARMAAEASECAASIGGNDAFWRFVDASFASGGVFVDTATVASRAGLNAQSIESCVTAETFKEKVDSQYQSGIAAGVTGTPGSFVVNAKGEAWFIPGAYPIEDVRQFINEALGNI